MVAPQVTFSGIKISQPSDGDHNGTSIALRDGRLATVWLDSTEADIWTPSVPRNYYLRVTSGTESREGVTVALPISAASYSGGLYRFIELSDGHLGLVLPKYNQSSFLIFSQDGDLISQFDISSGSSGFVGAFFLNDEILTIHVIRDGSGNWGKVFRVWSEAGELLRETPYSSNLPEGSRVEQTITGSTGGLLTLARYDDYGAGTTTLYVERLSANGTPIGDPIEVYSIAVEGIHLSDFVELENGSVVVVWSEEFPDNGMLGGTTAHAAIIGANGALVAQVAMEGTDPLVDQNRPTVAALENGGYLVTWESVSPDRREMYIYGQAFDATGNLYGDQFHFTEVYGPWGSAGYGIDTLADGRIVITYKRGTSLPEAKVFIAEIDPRLEGMNHTGSDLTDYIRGTIYDDRISGLAGVDSIFGSRGNDSIYGGDADDILNGAEEDDFLSGDQGSDSLSGGVGRDTLLGGVGNDTLDGEAGNDLLQGGTGDDILYGQADNDRLAGGAGRDSLNGGAGDDVLSGTLSDAAFDPLAAQVYRIYRATLDRDPDAAGLTAWVSQMSAGKTAGDVAGRFVASTEFQNRYGATDNTAFVTLLYQNVLDRAPDAGGLAAWTSLLDGGRSRADVVLGFANSREFTALTESEAVGFGRGGLAVGWGDEVFRIYRATLGRAPDVAGFEAWTEALGNGRQLVDVLNGFINSTEFRIRFDAEANADFVTLLYQNVLGRLPDATGLAAWTDALDSGARSRADVVRGFVQSAEFIASSTPAYEEFAGQEAFSDTLEGGGGRNILFGGLGADTFVFSALDGGTHIVADYDPEDLLRFTDRTYSPTEFRSHLVQSGEDVVFTDSGLTVILANTRIAEVNLDWITA